MPFPKPDTVSVTPRESIFRSFVHEDSTLGTDQKGNMQLPTLIPILCSALLVCSALLALHAVPSGAVGTQSALHLWDDEHIPKWYNRFNVEFNETSRILFRRETLGKWWYDFANGYEVIERADGRGDRYCGSIHPLQATPCRHLVIAGNRYLIFPELDECCLCCNAADGCGIVSPNWLQNATYEGTTTINDIPVYKWEKKGLQPNYWYATADVRQLPVELDMFPNNKQFFHIETFDMGPIDPSLLLVPDNCHSKCPISSICTLIY